MTLQHPFMYVTHFRIRKFSFASSYSLHDQWLGANKWLGGCWHDVKGNVTACKVRVIS